MVNYIDYITLNNQRIDTGYDFVNNWDSVEITLKVGYVENKTKNVWFLNEVLPGGNSGPVCVKMGSNTLYGTIYGEQPTDTYNFRFGGGIITPVEYNFKVIQNNTDTTINQGREGDRYFTPMVQPTLERYKVYKGPTSNPTFFNYLPEGRIYIGDLLKSWEGNIFNFYYFKLKINDELVVDIRACLDEEGNPAIYDEINQTYITIGDRHSNSMIKTVVMTGDRQELPIYDGIELDKLSNRIIEVNKYTDGYAGMYNEIAISADEDNYEGVEISDYTIDKQINQGGVADFIELKPRGTLVLPRNRQISALNRPMVKGHKGDLLRIVVR